MTDVGSGGGSGTVSSELGCSDATDGARGSYFSIWDERYTRVEGSEGQAALGRGQVEEVMAIGRALEVVVADTSCTVGTGAADKNRYDQLSGPRGMSAMFVALVILVSGIWVSKRRS
jgi:hypothetical protein